MRADKNARKYHSNDVWNAQFSHDNWRKKNDQHHHKEDLSGICNGKVGGDVGPGFIFCDKVNKKILYYNGISGEK